MGRKAKRKSTEGDLSLPWVAEGDDEVKKWTWRRCVVAWRGSGK